MHMEKENETCIGIFWFGFIIYYHGLLWWSLFKQHYYNIHVQQPLFCIHVQGDNMGTRYEFITISMATISATTNPMITSHEHTFVIAEWHQSNF